MFLVWFCPVARAEVVVTLPPLAGIVHLLEPRTDLFCLLPANADPHRFAITPKLIERLHRSELLIRASRDDSGWPGLGFHPVSIDLWPDRDHAWLQPEWLLARLPGLAEKLRTLNPERAAEITAALPGAINKIKALDKEIFRLLEPLRQAGVILQHASWRHFCAHYGIPVLAIANPRHMEGSLRPRQLEKLLVTLRRHPDARLWGDHGKTNSALQWLATKLKHKQVILLDPLGSCGESWSRFMQRNVARMAGS